MEGEKVRMLETEVAELKRLRVEDAKANEKVMGIFATKEQSWITEKRKLKLQIQALLVKFQIIESKKEACITQLKHDLEEKDRILQSRERELEERLKFESRVAEETRDELEKKLQTEALKHTEEVFHQKAAFIELSSNHRQLEAEMARITRESETMKEELIQAIAQKKAADGELGKLSQLLEGLQRDAEQKDIILSAMLRISKIDVAEKQVLMKEVKALKAKRRLAEMVAGRWRSLVESRRRKEGRLVSSVDRRRVPGQPQSSEDDSDFTSSDPFQEKKLILNQPNNQIHFRERMDVQALGVSYKLKRLKQQLLLFDKLKKPDCSEQRPPKELPLLMSLLNKQVRRYQSLEEKINDLCTRMSENERAKGEKDPDGESAKEESRRLEQFLEETFQVQRYLVATGQKMMDVQSRIGCTFNNCSSIGKIEDSQGFNLGQFADIVRGLFRDVQRGLEVRIARIIGSLEGTLARQGILHTMM